jgi:hypothetical protein
VFVCVVPFVECARRWSVLGSGGKGPCNKVHSEGRGGCDFKVLRRGWIDVFNRATCA